MAASKEFNSFKEQLMSQYGSFFPMKLNGSSLVFDLMASSRVVIKIEKIVTGKTQEGTLIAPHVDELYVKYEFNGRPRARTNIVQVKKGTRFNTAGSIPIPEGSLTFNWPPLFNACLHDDQAIEGKIQLFEADPQRGNRDDGLGTKVITPITVLDVPLSVNADTLGLLHATGSAHDPGPAPYVHDVFFSIIRTPIVPEVIVPVYKPLQPPADSPVQFVVYPAGMEGLVNVLNDEPWRSIFRLGDVEILNEGGTYVKVGELFEYFTFTFPPLIPTIGRVTNIPSGPCRPIADTLMEFVVFPQPPDTETVDPPLVVTHDPPLIVNGSSIPQVEVRTHTVDGVEVHDVDIFKTDISGTNDVFLAKSFDSFTPNFTGPGPFLGKATKTGYATTFFTFTVTPPLPLPFTKK
jgi:hypothetical protein